MALFHNGFFILMLGCFLPVARSSSPFLSADVRKEEKDAAERAIVDEANKDDIGDVHAPPPSNREGQEIMMPYEMGREHKKIQLLVTHKKLHEEFNAWTEPAPEDAAYEKKWDTEFPDPPEMAAADDKGKERPDFMSKVFDNGKNFQLAEKQAEDQDARINAEEENLNGDTTMTGMNNAFLAEEEAAKKHDGDFHGGHVAYDLRRWDSHTMNSGDTLSK